MGEGAGTGSRGSVLLEPGDPGDQLEGAGKRRGGVGRAEDAGGGDRQQQDDVLLEQENP